MESPAEFLAEIASHPRDLDARLVYADWLEEQGDPRGEFIRTQCELASPSDDFDRREILDQRQEQLRGQHEREWVGELRHNVTGWTFRCGFVESVEMTAVQFLQSADAVFAITPIRTITLLEASNVVDRIVDHPRIAELEGFHVERSELSIADTKALAAVPFVRLASLRLSGCRLVDETFVPLLDLNVPTLRDADFSANRLRNQAFAAMGVSPAFLQIEELNVMSNEIRRTGARQFATSRGFQNLTLLDVRRNPLGLAGVQPLFERFGEALRF